MLGKQPLYSVRMAARATLLSHTCVWCGCLSSLILQHKVKSRLETKLAGPMMPVHFTPFRFIGVKEGEVWQ